MNSKVGVYYCEDEVLKADYNLCIDKILSKEELIKNFTSARDNNFSSAFIHIVKSGTKCESIKKLLCVLRKELSKKTWKKIVVVTKCHFTYNKLIELMCTYFQRILQ